MLKGFSDRKVYIWLIYKKEYCFGNFVIRKQVSRDKINFKMQDIKRVKFKTGKWFDLDRILNLSLREGKVFRNGKAIAYVFNSEEFKGLASLLVEGSGLKVWRGTVKDNKLILGSEGTYPTLVLNIKHFGLVKDIDDSIRGDSYSIARKVYECA